MYMGEGDLVSIKTASFPGGPPEARKVRVAFSLRQAFVTLQSRWQPRLIPRAT